jgi:predicted nuclease of predicted toxin-antitoxin system
VKLLVDQNLSSRLVLLLRDAYPGSLHVRDCGLKTATDLEIWEYAKQNGLTIVSKDSDFRNRSLLLGSPPKVIWLRTENCSTAYAEFVIRASSALIAQFAQQNDESCLVLGHLRKER